MITYLPLKEFQKAIVDNKCVIRCRPGCGDLDYQDESGNIYRYPIVNPVSKRGSDPLMNYASLGAEFVENQEEYNKLLNI